MRKDGECCCKGACVPVAAQERPEIDRRAFIKRAALLAGSASLCTGVTSAGAYGASPPEIKRLKSARQTAHEEARRYFPPVSREYNGPYAGANLNRVAFPIGGLGAGMFCLEGTGALSHMSVRNRMEFFHEPQCFAAVSVKGSPNVARVLEGPIPDWKYFGSPGSGNGSAGSTYGFPRFRKAACLARFPFLTIELSDEALPLEVTITGWSPFTPGDADNSSLPAGAIEYTFHNTSDKQQEAVFSFNTKNFLAGGKAQHGIGAFPKGFQLWCDGEPQEDCSFAVFADADQVVVDHCWFRGGWWDAATLAWRNVAEGRLLENPARDEGAPGASLFVPFSVAAGASHTIRLLTAWYAGNTNLRFGNSQQPAFARWPSRGTAAGQQPVTGFLGEKLINTFDPHGDGSTGVLKSPEFRIKQKMIHFLIGGGSAEQQVALELLSGGKVLRTASGMQTEALRWESWEVAELKGNDAVILMVDNGSGGWGHLCVDQIVFSDAPIEKLKTPDSNALHRNMKGVVFEDFESPEKGKWTAEGADAPEQAAETFHRPWYVSRFENVGDVAAYWKEHYGDLRERSALFRDTFYDTTLPPEVVEAVAANLTILKSPTVLRQADGRLWCWEGCSDSSGCCHGSCTHVWNYAQAIAHLFPDLERTLRDTEYGEGLYLDGRQAFRVNLPISPGGTAIGASDGQLGGILKLYREWRISGDTDWLRGHWPAVKRTLDWMIAEWDPRETGLLEESHHNTYDINYFGPDGHCGSFYLGALTAASKMGEALGEEVGRYTQLRDKGARRLEAELFNGEYFYQRIMTDELDKPSPPLPEDSSGRGYVDIVKQVNAQGPKYQYGTGCLSDGVLGFWLMRMCGLDDAVVDQEKLRGNLKAIHRYNLKRDLSGHANPQRPAYAMGNEGGLLLCTWPKGGALAIPFVYSDEVWTGIEYQVASHLMLEGMIDEGLEIVRICRDRYDGVRRNPFNEYECGHWYARALSSYGLLQGLTGLRYDAIDKSLYINKDRGDFRAFLSTATGFGIAGMRNGEPFVEVKQGEIEVAEFTT